MIRFEKVIGEIYGLGKPMKKVSKDQADVCRFLGSEQYRGDWYHTGNCGHSMVMPLEYKYDGNISKHHLLDHLEAFKNDLVFIPYTYSVEELEILLKNNIHFQLCLKYGMTYRLCKPDNKIFKSLPFSFKSSLVILNCDNWTELRKSINRDLLEMVLERGMIPSSKG